MRGLGDISRLKWVARISCALRSAFCGACPGYIGQNVRCCAQNARATRGYKRARLQFERALEDKLGRSGECDIGESLTVAAKING